MAVKPASIWKANWDAARSRVQQAYIQGVEANTDFFEQAVAGQPTYEAMMTNPSVLARRLTGLQTKSSQADWKAKSVNLGGPRISAGMAAGKPKYDSAADKSRAILESVVGALPPRVADFRQNIMSRSIPVVEALKQGWGKL